MYVPVIGTWMKFNLKTGQRVIGRVTNVDEVSITIDNAAPTAGGFHKSFTFAITEVGNCGPADSQREAYKGN